jgi:hypothetical protein
MTYEQALAIAYRRILNGTRAYNISYSLRNIRRWPTVAAFYDYLMAGPV